MGTHRAGLFKPTNSKQSGVQVTLPVVTSSASASRRKEYLRKWTELLQLELAEEVAEVETRLRSWTDDRLSRDGFSVLDLAASFAGYRSEDVLIKLVNMKGGPLPFNRLSNGDMIRLLNPGARNGELVDLEGLIVDRSRLFLIVSLKESPASLEEYVWRVDKGANRVNHDRCLRALQLITSAKPAELYTGQIDPQFIPGKEPRKLLQTIVVEGPLEKAKSAALNPSLLSSCFDMDKLEPNLDSWPLNASQKRTIRAALSQTLTLIQGPPGTGKTHTAVHLIKLLCEMFSAKKMPILACAYTNVATDNLLEGLRGQGVSAIRVGKPVKVRPELRDATLDHQLGAHHKAEQLESIRAELLQCNRKIAASSGATSATLQRQAQALRARLKALQNAMVADIIKEAPVICCTCIGAGDDLLKDFYFPFVVLDECTQASEPAILVPLANCCPQQVVMIGDHFQLPPTVKSSQASAKGMSVSLFSRLVNELGLHVSMLDVQYRMHPTIAEFPASHFYHGKLRTGIEGEQRPLVAGFPWPRDQPVAFIQISGLEKRIGDHQSILNESEAQSVCSIVKRVLEAGLKRDQLGIITPYAAQVRRIFDILSQDSSFHMNTDTDFDADEDPEFKEERQLGFSVSSVDGFQGREKDLIIFSAVRSNANKKVGFLKDWRRLNVALTRARRGLIVIGNRATLAEDEHWRSFFEYADSNKLLVDTDELMRLDQERKF